MNYKDKDFFILICFLVLMSSDCLNLDKHPSYISEKSYMLELDSLNAYSMLDRQKQFQVQSYFKFYKLELPKEILEYEQKTFYGYKINK